MTHSPPLSLPQPVSAALQGAAPWRPWAGLRRWWQQRAVGTAGAPRCLNLALQGGGAHGAFTWGVLDALLEEPSIGFEALSGSSAGAVNAVVMTHGWLQAGREGARAALSDFWLEVGRQVPRSLVSQGQGEAMGLTAGAKMLTQWLGLFAPGQLNPLGINPLREVLDRHIDFERIRRSSPFRLYVGATHVNTGRLRLFREHELCLDMLLASACLPKLHHPVSVDGEMYWDGGYSANPALFPLLEDSVCRDILLVLLSPLEMAEVGRSMEAIALRIQELGFTTHLLREMRMLAHAAGHGGQGGAQAGRFHLVDTSELELLRHSDTKMLAYAPFLEMLRDQGRERARRWLQQNLSSIGRRGTLDWSHWAG